MHRTIEDLFPKINQEDGIVAKQQEYYYFLNLPLPLLSGGWTSRKAGRILLKKNLSLPIAIRRME